VTDFVWPNGVRISSCDWRPITNSEISTSPLGGAIQTATRPGDKMGCRVRVKNSSGAERAKLRALVHELLGHANRCFLPDYAFKLRGSFPATEIIANADFSSTTGWSGTGAGVGTLTASDGTLRVPNAANGIAGAVSPTGTLVQYAPYVGRTLTRLGRYATAPTFNSFFDDGGAGAQANTTSTIGGYLSGVFIALNTSGRAVPQVSAGSTVAGDFFDLDFVSLSRCILADGGANLITRSDEYGNAYWTPSAATISSDTDVAFDGATTGDLLREAAGSAGHLVGTTASITVSGGTVEFAYSVALKVGARSFAYLQMVESSSGTAATAWFNVSTGAAGTTQAGANWSNVRSFVTSLGGGWYQCTIVAKKTNAATGLVLNIGAATADATSTFVGVVSQAALVLGRSTLSQSSVPVRLRQTSGTAIVADSQPGYAIHVKGLPVSTNGLLLRGDLVEINKIVFPVAADLNSNSSGLGYLILGFPPPRGISDNAPIVVNRPMGRMILMNDPEIPSEPGGNGGSNNISDFEFDFVQDLAA
jgi:hypothetical protein